MADYGTPCRYRHVMSAPKQAVVTQDYKVSVGIDAASKLSGVGRNTIYAWVNSGQLPAARIGRRGKVVIVLKDLKAFLARKALEDSNARRETLAR